MSQSADHYQEIYQRSLEVEARWLRFGARPKANSIQALVGGLGPPLESLCELGCGTGGVLSECMRRRLAKRYFAIDGSQVALEYVRKRNGSEVVLACHDLETGAPDLGVTFDLVVVSHVIEHLRNPEPLLRGLLGKCKYLVAEVPLENQAVPWATSWLKSNLLGRKREENLSGHVQFFSKGTFKSLIESTGWRIHREHRYSPYNRQAIVFNYTRNHLPVWRGLAPYWLSRLAGGWLSSRLLNAHFAVLAANESMGPARP
ncbi:MAG: class I SAM-dependent methyltransferase [Terriglobia bacterium]